MSAISTKIYAKDSSGTLRELQPETTISNVSGLQTALDGKVDTVSGKGLSTNDYTTAEKNKLSGIEANANNYVHPTTSGNKHIPSGGSSGKILGWSADGTAAWVDPTGGGGGDVSSVKVGSTTYNPDSSGIVNLPAYPTSLPASDVYSWAKASTKPSYTASDVGAASSNHSHSSASSSSAGFMSSTDKSRLDGLYDSMAKMRSIKTSPVFDYKINTHQLNSLSWTKSGGGMYYSAAISSGLSCIFSLCLSSFGNLRATDMLMLARTSSDSSKYTIVSNTNSFATSASINVLIFGLA